jgi:hypothetical protein
MHPPRSLASAILSQALSGQFRPVDRQAASALGQTPALVYATVDRAPHDAGDEGQQRHAVGPSA